MMLGSPGTPATSSTRPPNTAGPMERQCRPARSSGSTFRGSLASGDFFAAHPAHAKPAIESTRRAPQRYPRRGRTRFLGRRRLISMRITSPLRSASGDAEAADFRPIILVVFLQVVADVPEGAVVARVHGRRGVVLPAKAIRLRSLSLREHRFMKRQ